MSENDDSPGEDFEKVDVEPIDTETFWADESGESEGEEPAEGVTKGDPEEEPEAEREEATQLVPTGEADTDSDEPSRGERVIDKQAYCHQCPHLSLPPELECLHPGTEILEVVDGERFRVRNCPVVEREEAFEDGSSRA